MFEGLPNEMERFMHSTPDFSLDVEGVNGVCPAGERWAEQQIAESRIPVFSCEGPCIRGDMPGLQPISLPNKSPTPVAVTQRHFLCRIPGWLVGQRAPRKSS